MKFKYGDKVRVKGFYTNKFRFGARINYFDKRTFKKQKTYLVCGIFPFNFYMEWIDEKDLEAWK